jgi:23S rRNA maturation-related 3'-5' exoribonuclease YhaM
VAEVIEKELRPKRNGGAFLALRFADRGGELDGKVWDNRSRCPSRSSETKW